MPQPSREPCKKQACDIQACLNKNNFDPQRCLNAIELLQSCCEKCEYKSTHCASLSGLLKTNTKQGRSKDSSGNDPKPKPKPKQQPKQQHSLQYSLQSNA
ncbi:hypothetical protein ACLOJK_001083 [Asimina triloba]